MDDRVMALLVDLHRTLELPAARLRPQAALEQLSSWVTASSAPRAIPSPTAGAA